MTTKETQSEASTQETASLLRNIPLVFLDSASSSKILWLRASSLSCGFSLAQNLCVNCQGSTLPKSLLWITRSCELALRYVHMVFGGPYSGSELHSPPLSGGGVGDSRLTKTIWQMWRYAGLLRLPKTPAGFCPCSLLSLALEEANNHIVRTGVAVPQKDRNGGTVASPPDKNLKPNLLAEASYTSHLGSRSSKLSRAFRWCQPQATCIMQPAQILGQNDLCKPLSKSWTENLHDITNICWVFLSIFF